MRTRLIGAAVALGVVAAACGNSPSTTDGASTRPSTGGAGTGASTLANATDLHKNLPSKEPGVTDTEIRVGGVVSKTNVLGLPLDQAFQGAKAYFEMINSQGGIYGRKLALAAERDDRMVNNPAEIEALISQDKVFAILPVATLLFTGADIAASKGIPTFGWNINAQWEGPTNLFGEKGHVCIDCAYPTQPWLAKTLGAEKVALLAYNVDQSKECADGIKKSFARWPSAEIAYTDNVPFGEQNLSVQVSKMKDASVELVLTCMDTNGSITLAREMNRQELDVPQYLQNGYDFNMLNNFGDLFEGSYVLSIFTPFEVPNPPPGLQKYFEWIDKTGGRRGELSLAGWLNADLFYRGLVAAGPEFTRTSVVDAINQMTDWTADGIMPPINWTYEHERDRPASCGVISKIENRKFVPQFGTPTEPRICLDNDTPELPDQPRTAP